MLIKDASPCILGKQNILVKFPYRRAGEQGWGWPGGCDVVRRANGPWCLIGGWKAFRINECAILEDPHGFDAFVGLNKLLAVL